MCGATQSAEELNMKDDSPSAQRRKPSIIINDEHEEADVADNGATSPALLSAGNATGSGRTRVSLKPGHSLMDWIKLTAKASDLSGTGGQIRVVSLEELAQHKSESDCWLCVRGQVYNVTPYLHFHPGGVDEMMRGAGSDATDLFNEIHRYVNFESMLKKCYIGPLKGST